MTEEEKQEKKIDPIYSEQAYDNAFRTMEGHCDDILIPFVAHMFGEHYGSGAVINRLRNDHIAEHDNGKQEKRTTDSSFEITYNDVTKLYHLECESSDYDGTMLVRIFEYSTQIAKDLAEKSLTKIKLRFPNSGLLVLKHSGTVPNLATIEMEIPDGRVISYDVPLMKMSYYSIEDIFEKHLFMLIPFYIFNYGKSMNKMNEDEDELNAFIERYRYIFKKLNEELEKGTLSALSYSAIIRLTHSVAFKYCMKQGTVQKRVGEFMGGEILDLPEFKIYAEGKAEGRAEGKAEGKAEGAEERHILENENIALKNRIAELEKQLSRV